MKRSFGDRDGRGRGGASVHTDRFKFSDDDDAAKAAAAKDDNDCRLFVGNLDTRITECVTCTAFAP